ncbi:MAG TPA: glutamate 5-kinase [Candidatus Angelobacter sp.]|nr:glutamate 5-kinase [Candidatus Angelobacter sp.]
MYKYHKIVIKVGTKVLTNEEGVLDETAMIRVVSQISKLKEDGYEVTLVSSGAMGAGKSILNTSKRLTEVSQKQLFAAVGQAYLMSEYSRLFREHSLLCAQVLATKEDFRDRSHFFNMRNCLETLLHDQVVPIVNENDVVSLNELAFTDNDELAGLVASMLNADLLLILSSVDGVLDTNGNIVSEISNQDYDNLRTAITRDKSEAGRGGMSTKFAVAKRAAKEGIEVFIANGLKEDTIVSIINGEKLGTRFVPGKRLTSAQRRLAHSDSLTRGRVYINECAVDIMNDDKVASLLPIGITKLEGDFEKGDVIEICDKDGNRLGYGVSQYANREVQEHIGKKNGRPLIHYDYMFIE